MPRRALALSTERLADLTGPELAALAGAQPDTWDCWTVGFTCTIGYTEGICPTVTLQPECIP